MFHRHDGSMPPDCAESVPDEIRILRAIGAVLVHDCRDVAWIAAQVIRRPVGAPAATEV